MSGTGSPGEWGECAHGSTVFDSRAADGRLRHLRGHLPGNCRLQQPIHRFGIGAGSSVSSAAPSSAPASAAQGTANPSTTIVGTWGTGKTYTSPEQPFVTFVDGGTWTASDGCNNVQGTWKESAPGTLVVTSGPHTMMACEGAPLPSAVASTHTYKLAGEKLTLFDETGTELVSLVPQAAEAAPAPSPSATSG